EKHVANVRVPAGPVFSTRLIAGLDRVVMEIKEMPWPAPGDGSTVELVERPGQARIIVFAQELQRENARRRGAGPTARTGVAETAGRVGVGLNISDGLVKSLGRDGNLSVHGGPQGHDLHDADAQVAIGWRRLIVPAAAGRLRPHDQIDGLAEL